MKSNTNEVTDEPKSQADGPLPGPVELSESLLPAQHLEDDIPPDGREFIPPDEDNVPHRRPLSNVSERLRLLPRCNPADESGLGPVKCKPAEWTSCLKELFGKFRRYRCRPPTADVVQLLVDQGFQPLIAEELVERCCSIFTAALKICGGNRQDACVLCALELRAIDGHRTHDAWELDIITGQRRNLISRSLERFEKQGVVDRVDKPYWGSDYELIRPIWSEEESVGDSINPIELLRLENEELEKIPDHEFHLRVIDAARAVTEVSLNKEETGCISAIADRKMQMQADRQSVAELEVRINEHQVFIKSMKRKLSQNRWARRHPFAQNVEHEPEEQLPFHLQRVYEQPEEVLERPARHFGLTMHD